MNQVHYEKECSYRSTLEADLAEACGERKKSFVKRYLRVWDIWLKYGGDDDNPKIKKHASNQIDTRAV